MEKTSAWRSERNPLVIWTHRGFNLACPALWGVAHIALRRPDTV